MPQHDEQVQRAIDVITPYLERLPAEVEAAVVMELVTRWLCRRHPGFARDPILAGMVRAVREIAPDMDILIWGPDGHPQKEPLPTKPKGNA